MKQTGCSHRTEGGEWPPTAYEKNCEMSAESARRRGCSTGRSGTVCSADLEGRQASRGGDGLAAGPLKCKRSAQASGMEAQRGETPSVARCAARQRDPASPGDARTSVEPAMRLYSKPQKHETTFTHLRKPTEPYIRKSDFVLMQKSGFACLRQSVHPQTRQSAEQVKRKKYPRHMAGHSLAGVG